MPLADGQYVYLKNPDTKTVKGYSYSAAPLLIEKGFVGAEASEIETSFELVEWEAGQKKSTRKAKQVKRAARRAKKEEKPKVEDEQV